MIIATNRPWTVVLTASTPRAIIEVINGRLAANNLSLVNASVEKIIRKTCRYPEYRLSDGLNFLLDKNAVKSMHLEDFTCFQRVQGRRFYEACKFKPGKLAILVEKTGMIYLYLPNFPKRC